MRQSKVSQLIVVYCLMQLQKITLSSFHNLVNSTAPLPLDWLRSWQKRRRTWGLQFADSQRRNNKWKSTNKTINNLHCVITLLLTITTPVLFPQLILKSAHSMCWFAAVALCWENKADLGVEIVRRMIANKQNKLGCQIHSITFSYSRCLPPCPPCWDFCTCCIHFDGPLAISFIPLPHQGWGRETRR